MSETTPEQLRQELGDIESEISAIRASTDDLKARSGAAAGGVEDPEEQAADLTSIEEQEAILGVLEQRRESLLERLGGSG